MMLWFLTCALAAPTTMSAPAPAAGEAEVDVEAPPPRPTAAQRVAELEWGRAASVHLVAELPGADDALRERIARALGRLRDPSASDTLAELVNDTSPAVRRQAAASLGWTPNTAPMLRQLLAERVVPPRGFGVASEEEHLVAALLESLGHQGTSRDVALLRRQVHQPWPVGVAAAHALGRLGIREVPAVAEAVPDLADQLTAGDPRKAEAAAFALRRVGMSGASDDVVQRVAAGVLEGPTSQTRAWSLQAVWPELASDQRIDLFLECASSTRRPLKVAAFDVVGPGDIDGTIVGAWTRDPDPWVRQAAVGALGRLGDRDEELLAIAEEGDPWAAAEAVRALGEGDVAVATDPDVPVPLRAAHAAGVSDPDVLLELATSGPAPVQSSALLAMLSLDGAPASLRQALAASDDPVLQELAVELLVASAPKNLASVLLRGARDAAHPDVLAAHAEALVALHREDGRALRGTDVKPLVARLAEQVVPRAQLAAVALAEAGRVEVPPRAPRLLPSTFGPPPEHDAFERTEGWPRLTSVADVRGAQITTDHGTFVVAFDPAQAPLAVAAFVLLAEVGFYDGLPLHRVVPGFVAQGGDPRGDGWGGPGWALPDEVSHVPFEAGSLGMARGGPDSAGSQWFVTTTHQPHLVGAYTRFGEVVDGLTAVQRMPVGTLVESVVIDRRSP